MKDTFLLPEQKKEGGGRGERERTKQQTTTKTSDSVKTITSGSQITRKCFKP